MKDFLGTPLEVGDKVVAIAPGYKEFVKAVIIAQTPKMFRIKYDTTDESWHYSMSTTQTVKFPNQLILIK